MGRHNMNGYQFITETEYTEILAKIAAQEHFVHQRIINKIKFSIHSSNAGCDWQHSSVKNGDYIVLTGILKNYGDYHGQGSPLTKEEASRGYAEIVNGINSFLKSQGLYKEPVFKSEEYEQTSLF